MAFYRQIISSKAIPWRFRHGLERWVETTGRSRHPGLYRWLHFGKAVDPVKPVTRGPLHHFYGYYDKSPWNASQTLLLAHEADFNDRAPNAGDRVGVGIVHLRDGNRYERLADSHAWNWQQGSMAQWHPADPERLLVHNDSRGGRFVGVVRDTIKGEQAVYDRPLYALLPDGLTGFSLNFARLAVHRPGYGYAGGHDVYGDEPHPGEDGIWRVDMGTGQSDLIVSLAALAAHDPKPSMEGAWHYVNHIQPSRGGQRIAFFHIWHRDAQGWEVRLYTCRPDGSELTCLLDTGFISHYDWRDDDTILVWANRPDAQARFLLLSHTMIPPVGAPSGANPSTSFAPPTTRAPTPVGAALAANPPQAFAPEGAPTTHPSTPVGAASSANQTCRVFGEANLVQDGHCTFSPDHAWVLNDTYPDTHQMRTLMLVRFADERRFDIARLHSPKSKWWGEIRCDLHPRWSRDGRQVCIDSVHDGSRQIYVVDVGDTVR
jgi:hypothetical protein